MQLPEKTEDQKHIHDMWRAGKQATCFPSRRWWMCHREAWSGRDLRNGYSQKSVSRWQGWAYQNRSVTSGWAFLFHQWQRWFVFLEPAPHCVFISVASFAMLQREQWWKINAYRMYTFLAAFALLDGASVLSLFEFLCTGYNPAQLSFSLNDVFPFQLPCSVILFQVKR